MRVLSFSVLTLCVLALFLPLLLSMDVATAPKDRKTSTFRRLVKFYNRFWGAKVGKTYYSLNGLEGNPPVNSLKTPKRKSVEQLATLPLLEPDSDQALSPEPDPDQAAFDEALSQFYESLDPILTQYPIFREHPSYIYKVVSSESHFDFCLTHPILCWSVPEAVYDGLKQQVDQFFEARGYRGFAKKCETVFKESIFAEQIGEFMSFYHPEIPFSDLMDKLGNPKKEDPSKQPQAKDDPLEQYAYLKDTSKSGFLLQTDKVDPLLDPKSPFQPHNLISGRTIWTYLRAYSRFHRLMLKAIGPRVYLNYRVPKLNIYRHSRLYFYSLRTIGFLTFFSLCFGRGFSFASVFKFCRNKKYFHLLLLVVVTALDLLFYYGCSSRFSFFRGSYLENQVYPLITSYNHYLEIIFLRISVWYSIAFLIQLVFFQLTKKYSEEDPYLSRVVSLHVLDVSILLVALGISWCIPLICMVISLFNIFFMTFFYALEF